jgi:hypothetical protein
MIHYHGTPISPRPKLFEMAGRNFCVSYADYRDIEMCHQIGQSVMIDNGAFSIWKRNREIQMYPWDGYYAWVRPWLDYHTTWCVIPDVINGSEEENDRLILQWCSKVGVMGFKAAPVWHLHESLDRLDYLIAGWPRVCFGSSGEYAQIGTTRWNNRLNTVFNRICKGRGTTPSWIHMLRGMSLAGSDYPFSSVDSTDVAQNHHIQGNPDLRAKKWDAQQCPALWNRQPVQVEILEDASAVAEEF